MFKNYILSHHKDAIIAILKDPDKEKHFPLLINFVELFEADSELGTCILNNPEETLKQCDKTLLEIQRQLIVDSDDASTLWEKEKVHTRIYSLPACPEVTRTIFPSNQDLNLFLQVTGTIVRIAVRKMLEYRREYICKKCKYKITIEADYDCKYVFKPPKICKNPEFCSGTNIVPNSVLDSEHCKDYQEIKMQEQMSKVGVGTIPNSMWVTLEDDLVELCKPGDNITVCGTLRRRCKPPTIGKKIEMELVLKANCIQINNHKNTTITVKSDFLNQIEHFWNKYREFPLYGRDVILRSFCSQIYGMYIVKLAVATILAGGSVFQNDLNTGVRKRTEPHLLLVGDPGMGKSEILKYAARVIPRSVLTTGVGSTSAGLTVAAVMEDGEWHLEGGALVLADGGICCIDEFNSMKEHDRASIHEAMEQQTISVAKASIVTKLSTRCSVLASTNPKGFLDPKQSLSITVGIASPLLSRFDLILLLKDNINEDWDEGLCDYILRGNKHKSKFIEEKHNCWSFEMIQTYFYIIKKLNPQLTETTSRILSTYYQLQRRSENMNKARTTVRLLDSLVRLSQAHARLMYHKNVEVMDAITAIILIESSMQENTSTLSLDFDSNANFPDDPMKCYEEVAKIVLKKLNLENILYSEMMKPGSPNKVNSNKETAGSSKISKNIDITLSQIENLKNKETIVTKENDKRKGHENITSEKSPIKEFESDFSRNDLKENSLIKSSENEMQNKNVKSRRYEETNFMDVTFKNKDNKKRKSRELNENHRSTKRISLEKVPSDIDNNEFDTILKLPLNKDKEENSKKVKSNTSLDSENIFNSLELNPDSSDILNALNFDLEESEKFDLKNDNKNETTISTPKKLLGDKCQNISTAKKEQNCSEKDLQNSEQHECTFDRKDISQNTKIKLIKEKFSYKPREFNKVHPKETEGVYSRNTSFMSQKSIFETDEEVDFDI